MGYHTHFYAYDKNKQIEWAKEILTKYKKQLQKELKNIPSDDIFKNIYNNCVTEANEEHQKKFYEDAKKYNWGRWFVEEEENFFAKYNDPNRTWEDEKKDWVERLERIKGTGLLEFEYEGEKNYPGFLIGNWELFDFLNDSKLDLNYKCREGKIYSGNILKRYYRVKGRYCQSMWFNWEGIIEMIEDYVDVTKTTKTGKNPKLELSKEAKEDIENFFRDYPDSYCWVE